MRLKSVHDMSFLLNSLLLSLIVVILTAAFVFQFWFQELPCPLCLLQRIGFIMIAFGFLMNLRFGFQPSHYAISLISALFTAFVALRQIVLHIVPGTGSYGSSILGLHMYTWSFMVSMTILLFSSMLLGIERQYEGIYNPQGAFRKISHVLFLTMFVLTIANFIAALI